MKITDSNLNGVSTAAQQGIQQQSASAKNRGGSANSVGSRDDRVQLSNLGSTLKALSSGSPEREAQISHLTSAYQAGAYAVNSAAVGSSMISEAMSNS